MFYVTRRSRTTFRRRHVRGWGIKTNETSPPTQWVTTLKKSSFPSKNEMLNVGENMGKLMPLFTVVRKSNVVSPQWNIMISTQKRDRKKENSFKTCS